MKQTLLLADNDDGFRETWRKVLATAGYEVALASNPQQARSILQESSVDLAILDVRLEDDEPTDISGLELASDKAFRHIPKIMLTGFPTSFENLRRVLGPTVDELPAATAFVDKAEGPKKLLEVIHQTFATWPRLRMSTIKVSEQTKADYEAARRQAKLNYGVAFTVSIFGFLVIIAGICLAWGNKLTIGIVATASGLIIETLSYLFFKRLDTANARMDTYHRELLETYWLELLMGACEYLPAQRQVACTEQAISAAINRWLAPPSRMETRLASTKTDAQAH